MKRVAVRQVPAMFARPAPGVLPGDCWTGCGKPKAKYNGFFCSRHCRSTTAPDGRLITEHLTKWCQTCSRRLPKSEFPIRLTKTKRGYEEKLRYYCKVCERIALNEMQTTPEARARSAAAARELYHTDPAYRQRKLDAGKRRRQQVKADPELHQQLILQKRAQGARKRKRDRIKRETARIEQYNLDRDPLVIPRGDPMLEWLYEQIELYASDRDLSCLEVVGPLMGGKNWMRWKLGSRASGGHYMPMTTVDAVLTRLDLTHRFDDFEFKRRSEWKSLRGQDGEGDRRGPRLVHSHDVRADDGVGSGGSSGLAHPSSAVA